MSVRDNVQQKMKESQEKKQSVHQQWNWKTWENTALKYMWNDKKKSKM